MLTLIALVSSLISSSAQAAGPSICFPNAMSTPADAVANLTSSSPEATRLGDGADLCSGYNIVDFHLYPSGSTVEIYGVDESLDALVEGSSPEDCLDLSVRVMFFTKTSTATRWTSAGSGALSGEWVDGGAGGFSFCELVLDSGTDLLEVSPPSVGATDIRVAVSATVAGVSQVTGAEAALPPVPPS